MRFDYSGPFRKSGKAAIVGDSALWVIPEDDFSALVALAPLFWAALGLPQMPTDGTALFGLSRPQLKAWRYITAGDTLNFVIRGDPVEHISGEVRRGGRTVGVTEVEMDPATGLVVRARIDLPIDVSRFEFTVEDVDTLATFDASIWQKN
ncbi:MAG: hypothetical protein GY778_09960 [bacterium]|nr:hypothetical protein [bacterium]